MTITTLILFIIILILPSTYQRIHFALRADDFLKISLRKKVGLQIHHGHWGLLWIFVSSMWLIFGDKSIYPILLAGFGWGLLLDEIVPALRMPSDDRLLELEIYRDSTKATVILLGIIVLLIVGLFFLLK